MSRSMSLTAREAMFAPQTMEVFLVLLTISHDDLGTDLRFVYNQEDIESRGEDYIAYPFTISLPDDDGETLARVTLTIDNVDRQIVQAVRMISSAPAVTMEIVLASDPDTVEAGPFNFTMTNAEYNSLTVQGELSHEDILNEGFPGDSFIPAQFPGGNRVVRRRR